MSWKKPSMHFFIVTSTPSPLARNHVILIFLQENAHLVRFHTVLGLCSLLPTINYRKYLHFNNFKNNSFTPFFQSSQILFPFCDVYHD